MFDLVSLESTMTRREAEALRQKKATRKLMEELCTAPPTAARPTAIRLKPSRCASGPGGPPSELDCRCPDPWLWPHVHGAMRTSLVS